MEYINEININEAVIHILDSSAEEPVLNQFRLSLDEETYRFILRHVERCLKDEELKYAVFNQERNIVKEISQEFLSGSGDILDISKEMARQLFMLMKSNGNIPSCDLLVVSFSTEFGPMLGVLKMDYIKNYTHMVNSIEGKVGINIIPELTGLPVSSQRIQKCAFIKTVKLQQDFDLMVIDKQNKSKESENYGTNYFISKFLGCSIIDNERDMTKKFLKASEDWTRENLKDDAASAESFRRAINNKLKEEDNIDIKSLTQNYFSEKQEDAQNFINYISSQGVENNIQVDKTWVEKKLKRIRMKIDNDIDLYINEDAYNDNSRFQVQRVGDGSINIIIKNVVNFIQK